jgi:hypothetical protein
MIRKLTKSDLPLIIKWMEAEGIDRSKVAPFNNYGSTWVIDEDHILKGMVTLQFTTNGLLYVTHMLVPKIHRNTQAAAYKLMIFIKCVAKMLKQRLVIFSSPKSKPFITKILSKYLKTDPYGEDTKNYYFILGV